MKKSLLLLILALLTGVSASAYSFAEDNDDGVTIYYSLNPGATSVRVTFKYDSYNSYSGRVVIPSTVTHDGFEFPVTAIGEFAFFKSANLTDVTIPSSIKEIGKFAFADTGIIYVTVPASVTSLGDYAFYDCPSLSEVSLPNTIPAIGECTFSNCVKLVKVNIPLSAKSIGEQAFYYCRVLSSVTIPQSVEEIGVQAFAYCNVLTDVTLEATAPSKISVAADAFASSPVGAATLTVPAGCKTAYEGANVWKDFSSIDEAAPLSYSFYEVNKGSAIYYNCKPGLTSVSVTYKDDSYNSYSGEVVIPSSVTHEGTEYAVTSIGEKAFYKSLSLTDVTIPSSIREIGSHAFAYTDLVYVTVPSSVTTFGNGVFYNCVRLFDVSLPNALTSIPVGTFANCTRLEKVNVPQSATYIGEQAFFGCYFLEYISIPSSVTEIGPQAFYGCSYLGQIALPSSVTVIGARAFEQSGLRSAIIPASVISIGEKAFLNCSSLRTVTVENTNPAAISLGEDVFSGIYSDASLHVPEGCQALYEVADQWKNFSAFDAMDYDFAKDNAYGTRLYYKFNPDGTTISVVRNDASYSGGCYSGDVTIPVSVLYNGNYYRVTAIGYKAFYTSQNLTSVHIPGTVTSIGELAFYYCLELKTVKIPDSVTQIGRNAFDSCRDLASVTLPANITTIDYGTFAFCESLTEVTLPNSVTSLGYASFQGCTSLASVTMSNAVKDIYGYVFNGCEKLTQIELPSTLGMIGMQAFENCKSLQKVTVQSANPDDILLGSNVFRDVPLAAATLIVPKNSKALYEAADQWKEFGTIEENGSSGVVSVEADAPQRDGACYDLQGRRVLHPSSGIYIIDGRKVLVK